MSLIQVGNWKRIDFLEDGRRELYNLANDIGETKTVANDDLAPTKELRDRHFAWRATVKAPVPTKNEAEAVRPKATGKSKQKGA
ncbi:MAG: hypothetical protein MUF06_13130 [Pirellulaceae bacterium]|nr:hypothetical protein [Pirellulaceae bacterium]